MPVRSSVVYPVSPNTFGMPKSLRYAFSLNGSEAHTTCRTEHKKRFARFELRPVFQRIMGGSICQDKS